jgi:peptidyl-prolyl cis-trans isomerase C
MPKFTTFLAVLAVTGAAALPVHAQDAATVIARVGEVELTLGHAIALRAQLPAQIQAAPDDRLFPALVQQMIDQEVLAQSQAAALTAPDRMRLDNEVRSFLSNVALQDAIDAAVTPQALAIAYGAFAEEFGAGDPVTEWNAAHILVRTEDEIAAVVDQLSQGRDFGDVAREVSTDGSSRQGGDLGWFGPGVMIPEFEETVRNLEPGQVSDPLQTRFGWHVVRLIDSRIASVPPLEAVQDRLAEDLRRAAVQALIEGLRGATAVTDLSQGLDPALLRRDDLMAP